MSDRITPDNTGGFHLPDGGRLTPDGVGGFHILPASSGLENAAVGLLMTIMLPIGILGIVIGVPAFVTFFIVYTILGGITQGMLGRPLAPAESSAIVSQACFASAFLWILVAIFVAPRVFHRRK